MNVVTFAVLVLIAVWALRPAYLKWKQRRKFREFEAERRRQWEQLRRE